VFFLLSLFFLIWAFLLSITSHSLARLGETRFLEIQEVQPKAFFYYPFHLRLFRSHTFEITLFATHIAANIARLGYALSIVLGVWETKNPLLLLALFFLLFLCEFIAYLWAFFSPQRGFLLSAPYSSLFLYLSLPLTLPFLKLTHWIAIRIKKTRGEDLIDEMRETIVQILRSAQIKTTLNLADKKLIEAVFKFKDKIVREVMVPRVDLFSLPAETPIREAAQKLVSEGYSRIPVYRDSVDNITGVLMFKTILQLYMDCTEGEKERAVLQDPIDTIAKSVFYTPETKKVSHLLQEFRSKQMHMAIVVDEYGGTEGVVTMEDILEEIVGEIGDEYDTSEEMLYTTLPGEKSWIVDARMSILDAEDIFGIILPQEGDYDTIGGYIVHLEGAIPPKGFIIHQPDCDLEILHATERSVEKIKITPKR